MPEVRPALQHLRARRAVHSAPGETDGTREEFDREKLLHGIPHLLSPKRPVSATDIARLVARIEATLQTRVK
jgi:transcriptional regulator NrdR family protein